MYYEVIPLKLFRQDAGMLTYSSDTELQPGQLVTIPLGKFTTTGIINQKVPKPPIKTKPIKSTPYQTPIPNHLLKSIHWLNQYYLTPLPTISQMVLPKGLDKNRRKIPETPENPPKLPIILLNPAQKQALQGLQKCPTPTKLLHGVTGSGKTNIYLKMASEALKQQKSTILLVPEIALTSQLVQVFENTFGGQVTLIHSNQTESTRHQIWEKLLISKHPQIIIGPRSALFAPVKDLGLIIIDEAHESAYYQENTPKYSALRLASFIASSLQIPCIQGTATPLVADYHLAKQHNSVITLNQKAKTTAKKPDIKIIDFKSKEAFSKNRYFSTPLLNTIKDNLAHHHQTLIFHNRRGSAPLTICENCGWQALCPNCFLPLTLHTDNYQLACHTCGHQAKIPHSCPECGGLNIIHKGFGTKLLESELSQLFPDATIARFDADNTKSTTLNAKYDDIKSGKIDIIIGTQTIAKGLDLPNLATVGVVQADAGLSLPDYSAEERTFHLLTQVLGRVGRGHIKEANAFIQTYQPDHPAITSAISADYTSFYNYLIKKRHKSHLPPFCYLAKVSITYKTEKTTLARIREAEKILQHQASLANQSTSSKSIEISAPTPAFHERTTSGYTWQIIIKSTSRQKLLGILKFLPKNSNTHVQLDPPSLL
ncbi:primosomal protein N' [Candidatus Saccharibacteria bacterium]|nr:primosomal protein N' [Candidatus Saccharibacteria bacterium]